MAGAGSPPGWQGLCLPVIFKCGIWGKSSLLTAIVGSLATFPWSGFLVFACIPKVDQVHSKAVPGEVIHFCLVAASMARHGSSPLESPQAACHSIGLIQEDRVNQILEKLRF